MNKIGAACLIGLINCLPLVCQAIEAPTAPQWYQVEVIIFDHITPKTVNAEYWRSHTNLVTGHHSIDLADYDPDTPDQAYQLLPQSQMTLMKEQKKIASHTDYHILAHYAWHQPITSKEWTQPIRIYGGEDYNHQSMKTELNETNYFSESLNHPNDNWQVNGTLTISKKRFISVNADIYLNLPFVEVSPMLNNKPLLYPNSDGLVSFKLAETRRMRTGELHYFDHPLLGMLVKITSEKTPSTPQAYNS